MIRVADGHVERHDRAVPGELAADQLHVALVSGERVAGTVDADQPAALLDEGHDALLLLGRQPAALGEDDHRRVPAARQRRQRIAIRRARHGEPIGLRQELFEDLAAPLEVVIPTTEQNKHLLASHPSAPWSITRIVQRATRPISASPRRATRRCNTRAHRSGPPANRPTTRVAGKMQRLPRKTDTMISTPFWGDLQGDHFE